LSGKVVCIDIVAGVFHRSKTRVGGSTVVCVRLEEDNPVVEEFGLSLWLVAVRDIWHGTSLVTTTQFAALSQVEVV
jgi:hypothetical protein